MKRLSTTAAATFLFLAPALTPSFAQTPAPAGPPKVLQIFREQVKPGKGAAHEKVEAGWPKAFAKAKWPTHYIALSSMTGPPEAWFLSGYESFAAMGADQQNVEQTPALLRELDQLAAQDGELLTGTRSITAVYREDLSYRPSVNIGEMRYFTITMFTLRPGYDSAFAESRKLVHAGHEKARMDEHWAMFQVTSGMVTPTYLLFLPMKALQEADLAQESHAKPYQDALGPEGRRQLREFSQAGVQSTESYLFQMSPKMSYPSKEVVAADPAFWTPKPAAATKPSSAEKRKPTADQ
jgi:hypothetical protein